MKRLLGMLGSLGVFFAGVVSAAEFRGLWVDSFGPGFFNSNQVAKLVKDWQ